MPNKTIFVSDIHLCESRPSITDAFVNFINKITNQVDALYILGDLFEYWIGDDSKQHENVISAIKALTDRHIKVFLMHGNRDFLLGPVFEKKTGSVLLEDPTLIKIYGKKILLCHGDSLCTDDTEYQSFKNKVRDESWKNEFLKKPLHERILIANEFRKQSELNKKNKSEEIMDANPDEVNRILTQFNYPDLFIHGHTHRPNYHSINLDGHQMQRIVLGDWYEQGSYLTLDLHDIKTYQL
ncbi:MAG: UDP-2,3-diacylglucosamine diphosphatase [Candidatus Methylopumilus sp.]|nr:UDP-2,3-diacylglucosamine diphosphatase [Candidatus Methylopumilus sp.]